MIVLRFIGWLLIAAALLALGWDIFFWIHDGHFALTPARKIWYVISPRSFDFAERVIEGHIWKPLWDPAILTLLLQPMTLLAGIPGLVLALLARPRRRRRFGR